MNVWRDALLYFPAEELRCKGSGELILDLRFAIALPALRQAWGRPLTLTSCCRSPAHNTAIKGHPRSLHLTVPHHNAATGTMAADIDWSGWSMQDRRAFDTLARSMGWSVGRALSFVHVDRRADIGLVRTEYNYAGAGAHGW